MYGVGSMFCFLIWILGCQDFELFRDVYLSFSNKKIMTIWWGSRPFVHVKSTWPWTPHLRWPRADAISGFKLINPNYGYEDAIYRCSNSLTVFNKDSVTNSNICEKKLSGTYFKITNSVCLQYNVLFHLGPFWHRAQSTAQNVGRCKPTIPAIPFPW